MLLRKTAASRQYAPSLTNSFLSFVPIAPIDFILQALHSFSATFAFSWLAEATFDLQLLLSHSNHTMFTLHLARLWPLLC